MPDISMSMHGKINAISKMIINTPNNWIQISIKKKQQLLQMTLLWDGCSITIYEIYVNFYTCIRGGKFHESAALRSNMFIVVSVVFKSRINTYMNGKEKGNLFERV